jgi:hypothetical protein
MSAQQLRLLQDFETLLLQVSPRSCADTAYAVSCRDATVAFRIAANEAKEIFQAQKQICAYLAFYGVSHYIYFKHYI